MAKNCGDGSVRRWTTDVVGAADDTPHSAFDEEVFVPGGRDSPTRTREV